MNTKVNIKKMVFCFNFFFLLFYLNANGVTLGTAGEIETYAKTVVATVRTEDDFYQLEDTVFYSGSSIKISLTKMETSFLPNYYVIAKHNDTVFLSKSKTLGLFLSGPWYRTLKNTTDNILLSVYRDKLFGSTFIESLELKFVKDNAGPVIQVQRPQTSLIETENKKQNYILKTDEKDMHFTFMFADSRSGLKSSSLSVSPSTGTTSSGNLTQRVLSFGSAASGDYKVTLAAEDNVGNLSSHSFWVYIDNEGPKAPGIDELIVHEAFLQFLCSTPEDQSSGSVPAGLFSYEWLVNDVVRSRTTHTSINLASSTFWPDRANIVKVRARDRLGNTGEFSKSKEVWLPSAPDITSVRYYEAELGIESNVKYPLSLTLSHHALENYSEKAGFSFDNGETATLAKRWADYFSKIERLNVFSISDDVNAEESCSQLLATFSGEHLLEDFTNSQAGNWQWQNAAPVFSVTLPQIWFCGFDAAHAFLGYRIDIVYKHSNASVKNTGALFHPQNEQAEIVSLPNYEARGDASLLLGEYALKDADLTLSVSGEAQTLVLALAGQEDGKDYEGDNVYYRLISNYNLPVTSWTRAGEAVPYLMDVPGVYKLNAEIVEQNFAEPSNGLWDLSEASETAFRSEIYRLHQDSEFYEIPVSGEALFHVQTEWINEHTATVIHDSHVGVSRIEDTAVEVDLKLTLKAADGTLVDDFRVYMLDPQALQSLLGLDDELFAIDEIVHGSGLNLLRGAIARHGIEHLTERHDNEEQGLYTFVFDEPSDLEFLDFLIVVRAFNEYYVKSMSVQLQGPRNLDLDKLIEDHHFTYSFNNIAGYTALSLNFDLLQQAQPTAAYFSLQRLGDAEANTVYFTSNDTSLLGVGLEDFLLGHETSFFNSELTYVLHAYNRFGCRSDESYEYTLFLPSRLPTGLPLAPEETLSETMRNTLKLPYPFTVTWMHETLQRRAEIQEANDSGLYVFPLPKLKRYAAVDYSITSKNSDGKPFTHSYTLQGKIFTDSVELDENLEAVHGPLKGIRLKASVLQGYDVKAWYYRSEHQSQWRVFEALAGNVFSFTETGLDYELEDGLVQLSFRLEYDDADARDYAGLEANPAGYAGTMSDILEYSFVYDSKRPVLNLVEWPTSESTTKREAFILSVRDENLQQLHIKIANTETDFQWEANETDFPQLSSEQYFEYSFSDMHGLSDGVYTLQIDAQDKAENSALLERTFTRDTQAPVIEHLELLTAFKDETAYYASKPVELVFSVYDERALERAVIELVASDESLLFHQVHDINSGPLAYASSILLSQQSADGEAVYVQLRLFDKAGNESLLRLEKALVWDSSGPAFHIESFYGHDKNKRFFSAWDDIHLSYSSVDLHSGIADEWIGVRREDQAEFLWVRSMEDLRAVLLQEGSVYTFAVKARNRSGLSSSQSVGSLTYSGGAVEIRAVELWHEGVNLLADASHAVVAQGAMLSLRILVDSAAAGIASYAVNWGTYDDSQSLSRLIPGNRDGQLVPVQNYVSFRVPNAQNGEHRLALEVTNTFGEGFYKDYGITIEPVLEQIMLSALPALISHTDYHLELFYYGDTGLRSAYQMSLHHGDGTIFAAWEEEDRFFDLGSFLRESGRQLEHGQTYYVAVEVETMTGERLSSRSNSFVYDTSAPEVSVRELASYTTAEQLGFTYHLTEDVSTHAYLEYAVDKLLDAKDGDGEYVRIVDWQRKLIVSDAQELKGEIQLVSLDVQSGDLLRIALRSMNSAATLSDTAYTQLIGIDTEYAGEAILLPQARYHNLKQDLRVNYFVDKQSVFSGIASVDYALVDEQTDQHSIEWRKLDQGSSGFLEWSFRESDAKAMHGRHLRVLFRQRTGAGLESISVSPDIIIDNEAPDIQDIVFIDSLSDSAGLHEDILYVESFHDILFRVYAVDENPDTLSYQLMEFDGTQFQALGELYELDFNSDNITYAEYAAIEKEINTEAHFALFVELKDKAGNKTTAYSSLIKRVVANTHVKNRVAYLVKTEGREAENTEELYFSWHIETNVPLKHIEAQLQHRNQPDGTFLPVEDFILDRAVRSLCFDALDLASTIGSGYYRLKLSAVPILGSKSESLTYTVLDFTPPEIVASYVSPYAYNDVKLSLRAEEDYSRITEVYFALGNAADNLAYTQGWTRLEADYSSARIFELDSFRESFDASGLQSGDLLYVSLLLNNSQGRQAQRLLGLSIVDLDGVDFTVRSLPEYTRDAKSIGALGKGELDITAQSSFSGLSHIGYAFLETDSSELFVPDDMVWHTYNAQFDTTHAHRLERLHFSVSSFELQDNKRYSLVFQAENKARHRQYFIVNHSSIKTDFQPPEVVFDVDLERFDTLDRYVVNDEGSLLIPVRLYDNSLDYFQDSVELASIFIEAASGVALEVLDLSYDALNSKAWIRIPIHDAEGLHDLRLTVLAVDQAGNEGTGILTLRYNLAPQISLNPETWLEHQGQRYAPTRPGKPMRFLDFLSYHDVQGYELVSYRIQSFHGARDPDTLIEFPEPGYSGLSFDTGEMAALTMAYLHKNPLASGYSQYMVDLLVTDEFGKESAVTGIPVLVHNTFEGSLYVDEYWQGLHPITGDIHVSTERNLSILPGSVVLFKDINNACGFWLNIAGSLTVSGFAQNPIVFRKEGHTGSFWGGIRIDSAAAEEKAEAKISHADFSMAERALLAGENSDVRVDSVRFYNNEIGLHNFSSLTQITFSVFQSHQIYAVKEETEKTASFLSNQFQDNHYDYYEPAAAVLNAWSVNLFEQNNGNTSDKGDTE